MKRLMIANKTHPLPCPLEATYQGTFWGSFRGLMLKKEFGPNDSILIDQRMDGKMNAAIHMLFMNFDIAAIWIASDLRVVDTVHAKPWRLAYIPSAPARYVLETHISFLDQFHAGDQVEFYDA